MIAFVVVVQARYKTFNKEFMKKICGKEHLEAFPGSKLPEIGFPDTGSGRYSLKLDYSQWVSFNNQMRVHMNIVE